MLLEEFFDYKNQLMEDLLTTESIVRLIDDNCELVVPAKQLAYTQVFPYEHVPETTKYGHTFVCFDVDIQSAPNRTYLKPVIYIWVFTHRSKMRLPEGGVRVDKLASEIAKKINGSRFYGLGELEFNSSKRFAPLAEYHGKVLTFQTMDFNNPRPTGKEIPSNRKRS